MEAVVIISKSILARPSTIGQYNFQYPNQEGEGILVPKGSELSKLNWVAPGSYQAFLWHVGSDARVVWIKDEGVS